MKKRVFLALLAAAAVTFVGCSKDDDGPDEGPQTYTITFEGDDWSPLVVANYNGGKAMSVVYEDKAYTWTDQTTQLTSPCPEGWGYPFMVSSYNSKDIEKFNSYELDLYLYNARNEDATTAAATTDRIISLSVTATTTRRTPTMATAVLFSLSPTVWRVRSRAAISIRPVIS